MSITSAHGQNPTADTYSNKAQSKPPPFFKYCPGSVSNLTISGQVPPSLQGRDRSPDFSASLAASPACFLRPQIIYPANLRPHLPLKVNPSIKHYSTIRNRGELTAAVLGLICPWSHSRA